MLGNLPSRLSLEEKVQESCSLQDFYYVGLSGIPHSKSALMCASGERA